MPNFADGLMPFLGGPNQAPKFNMTGMPGQAPVLSAPSSDPAAAPQGPMNSVSPTPAAAPAAPGQPPAQGMLTQITPAAPPPQPAMPSGAPGMNASPSMPGTPQAGSSSLVASPPQWASTLMKLFGGGQGGGFNLFGSPVTGRFDSFGG